MGGNQSSARKDGCDSSSLSENNITTHPPAAAEMATSQSPHGDKCPISEEQRNALLAQAEKSKNASNINPHNNMPVDPRQKPHPDQSFHLPTQRQVSSIPKGGAPEEENWVYPSPQMFYNAVKRKGGDADQQAMSTVVSIHNAVNEHCWEKILDWESLHKDECGAAKLVRFRGRYHDLSPLARVKMLLGWSRPFDRHDWVVDRCGKDVRYIIDYYEEGKPNPRIGNLDIHLDVRPALDSPVAIIDRIKKAVI